MTVLGIDVSHHQGPIDWPRVAAAGAAFAWLKATQGATHTDHLYAINARSAAAAGIVTGAYHFLDASDPQQQAKAFLAAVEASPVRMLALDVEHPDVTADHVAGFATELRRHTKRELIVYTGKPFWRRSGQGINGPAIGPLWTAGTVPSAYVRGTGPLAELWRRTGEHPTSGLPYGGWNTWHTLQFTDNARIQGINGPVDGNAFNGTIDQLTGDEMLTDAQMTQIATRCAEVLLNSDANLVLGGKTPNDANRVGELLLHTASRVTTIRERVSDVGLDQLAADIAKAVATELGISGNEKIEASVIKAVKASLSPS